MPGWRWANRAGSAGRQPKACTCQTIWPTALDGSAALYSDVWVSMGEEDQTDERIAHRVLEPLDLTIARTPVPEVRITEAAHWHPRRDADPAIKWLRELLYDVAIELEDAAPPA